MTGVQTCALPISRVGRYGLEAAKTLEQLAERFEVMPLAQAAGAAFPRRDLSADEARRLAHGGRLATEAPKATEARKALEARKATEARKALEAHKAPQAHKAPESAEHPIAAYAPDGTLVALLAEQDGQARPLVVFAGS